MEWWIEMQAWLKSPKAEETLTRTVSISRTELVPAVGKWALSSWRYYGDGCRPGAKNVVGVGDTMDEAWADCKAQLVKEEVK